MEDLEKKMMEDDPKKSTALPQATALNPIPDGQQIDQEKERAETDQAKPSLASTREILIPPATDKKDDTDDSSQPSGLAARMRLRLDKEKESALPNQRPFQGNAIKLSRWTSLAKNW
jgi:hypothetical protein